MKTGVPASESISLLDFAEDHSSCGVGFLTRKGGDFSHDIIEKVHEALCAVPHRGGMGADGTGDGAGVCIDLSPKFFAKVTGETELAYGKFAVGNFFLPVRSEMHGETIAIIDRALKHYDFHVIAQRRVPVNHEALRPASVGAQLDMHQWIFVPDDTSLSARQIDQATYDILLEIEEQAYTRENLAGFYPVSLSSKTQVLKGQLNSWEVIPYFLDLQDSDYEARSLFFHTRFSTNTDSQPAMAQPFRQMAHNGELNTDKKNRLSEDAIARTKNRRIHSPVGQSDSARLDQTLSRRIHEDELDMIEAVVAMMPPAWENDPSIPQHVRDMLEYFSLYEEKNDGPAAVIFGDGEVVGARLDRLGLRPLRSIETDDYLCAMSEAGQIDFPSDKVISRGRVESGGTLYYDHRRGRSFNTMETLEDLAGRKDYRALLEAARINLEDLPVPTVSESALDDSLNAYQRFVAYSLNQESLKLLMDPMLQNGAEKVSAMGYGYAINALSDEEGGMAKYFSQRFAQVTNPPLDSIREADGMTLRVALGARPMFSTASTTQIVIPSPVLTPRELSQLEAQAQAPVARFDMLFDHGAKVDSDALEGALAQLCDAVAERIREHGGLIVISDRGISKDRAALPLILTIAALNQRLINEGLRFRGSIIVESGQMASSHHVSTALGFGASAVMPLSVIARAQDKYASSEEQDVAIRKFVKACEKALMKTMGKVGLCTAESYIGGEFFEPNFFDTNSGKLAEFFPNMHSPVGGVGLETVIKSAFDWHSHALGVSEEGDIPLLGLFKERNDGAGHSYGLAAVRGFEELTAEPIRLTSKVDDEGEDGQDASNVKISEEDMSLNTVSRLFDAFGVDDRAYVDTSFDVRSPAEINGFEMTPGYRAFIDMMAKERARRPAALRDVLALPADLSDCVSDADILARLEAFDTVGNISIAVQGVGANRLAQAVAGSAFEGKAVAVDGPLGLKGVQPADEICRTFAGGAMSHGALVAAAHEAVAHGINMVGGFSNSGEGGEHFTRYGTLRASRIKQIASGRFGVWTGYLADPSLEELEIKIAQGAKPGEGGQLPGQKVTVEIAAARGGTPGVELVSPPPHHDTYSIEDLAQLIHDCKAARVRVIVKLVSSEGIGTIAVGVAKAGADIINVAGNTGGTGAAQVTSLKNTGRAAEIGLAEVHQALCRTGLRQKVTLRCSGAHQTGSDVVKSALLGGDSFEFGTTALMMLKCVMAKNCNVKCPAGLTTNAEAFEGDPRALAQYLINVAHEVREILAQLGLRSLWDARGRTDLLQLLAHQNRVGQMDMHRMLAVLPERPIAEPVYLEANFTVDDALLDQIRPALLDPASTEINVSYAPRLSNRNKTTGGQLAIDIERILQYEMQAAVAEASPIISVDDRGRRTLLPESLRVNLTGPAGQSFGAFCNAGMVLNLRGTANDGVGKGQSGGIIAVVSPGGGSRENALIGNFGLFGATGGQLFVEGKAGDRFCVRNSGATAVIEGVGDFGCEYMTNGAVLNLGGFGYGFCNGMSGGVAYQYDPEGRLDDFYSRDSVSLTPLSSDDALSAEHRLAARTMLERHVNQTNSALGRRILENWATEVAHFRYATPLALEDYQNYQHIVASRSRKDLVDELAFAMVSHQLAKLKRAIKDHKPMLGGAVPNPQAADFDPQQMFELVNTSAVLAIAQNIARERLSRTMGKDAVVAALSLDVAVQKLILTEDFSVLSKLSAFAKTALTSYSDEELAVLISNKRMHDYKAALDLRNVRLRDGFGTFAWITHQDRLNEERMGALPSLDELFAKASSAEVVKLAS